jgi:ketosteroid isomerase-like protein
MNVSVSQARIALAILGGLVVALALNHFILTDKKRIERTVREMTDAASKKDLDLLFSHVSANYRDDVMTRDELRSLAKKELDRYEPANARVRWVMVTVAGALAHAQVSVAAGEAQDGYTPWYGTSEWSLEFRKEADGVWRVTSITPTRFYGRDVSGWGGVLHYLH